jgi:hypothetical protein
LIQRVRPDDTRAFRRLPQPSGPVFAWQNRTVRHSDGDYLGLHRVRERPPATGRSVRRRGLHLVSFDRPDSVVLLVERCSSQRSESGLTALRHVWPAIREGTRSGHVAP